MKEATFWKLSLLSVGLLVLVMCVTWWDDPARAYELRTEGRFFQNLTVVLYLLASLAGAYFIIARKAGRVFLVVPVLGILLAGEELSWIERVTTPPIIAGIRVDALHDFVEVAYVSLSGGPGWRTVAFAFAISGILFASLPLARRTFPMVVRCPPLLLTVACLAAIAAAQVVDLMARKTNFQKYFFEELPENPAALLLLFAGLALAYQGLPASPEPDPG